MNIPQPNDNIRTSVEKVNMNQQKKIDRTKTKRTNYEEFADLFRAKVESRVGADVFPSHKAVTLILDEFCGLLVELLLQGRSIHLPNLGTLLLKHGARTTRITPLAPSGRWEGVLRSRIQIRLSRPLLRKINIAKEAATNRPGKTKSTATKQKLPSIPSVAKKNR
jgi:nucleoid DNA-binding protein